MKRYLSALIIASGVFVTTESSAQMGMGQMYGGGYGGYGRYGNGTTRMDRSIGTTQYKNGKKKKETEKVDLLEDALDHLEKELTLDSFQKAVIKDMLENNQTEEKKILAEDIPDESKLEKILILRNKLDEKIKPMLSKDQLDLFVKMKEKDKHGSM